MLEIRLIMDEKTDSNDKEKKEINYFTVNRNNSAVSVVSPRVSIAVTSKHFTIGTTRPIPPHCLMCLDCFCHMI